MRATSLGGDLGERSLEASLPVTPPVRQRSGERDLPQVASFAKHNKRRRMTYELHPLCTLFPRVIGGEFDALVSDIKSHGLRNPIMLHQGMILDGGNRYRACLEAGVVPEFVEFDGGSVVAFVLSANLHRRHLSPGQQAAIVASAQDWANAQTVGKPKSGNVTGLATVAERSAQSGASDKTQRMADKVAKADPELARRVAHGEISLPAAVREVSPPAPAPTQKVEELPSEDHDDELSEAHDTIRDLAEENEKLRDKLAIEAMDESEEAKTEAARTIAELRDQVATLERDNRAIKQSRDAFQIENAELKKQVQILMRKIKKAESGGGDA